MNGLGQIDILLPEGIGTRAKRIGVRGGTTLETPGGQNVLDRSEKFDVVLDRVPATIFRPSIQGALLAKAFAYGVPDPRRRRHLLDLAVLSTLIRVSDRVGEGLSRRERSALFTAREAACADAGTAEIDGAEAGLQRLSQAMNSAR